MRSAPTRVIYVTDAPTVAGAEHVLLSYIDRLRPPDFETHVFLRHTNVRLRDALARRGAAYTASESFSERIVRTTARPDDLWHFATRFRRVSRELTNLLRRSGAQILHSISYPSALYAAFAARSSGVRHIWHQHDIKRVHSFNWAIYRFAADTCDYVVGPSNAVTSPLARAGMRPPRLCTVYNGIDLGRFVPESPHSHRTRQQLGLAEHQPAVCLVGQLLPYKGHRTLIDAAPRILRHFPTTRFFIVGSLENPPYEAALRAWIATADLDRHFEFTGWRSDVPDIIAAMDVSVVATTTPEPAALTLMETMAVARPVVASRTGGTPELVVDGETGLLFGPGRSDELADRVIDLLRSPERRRQLGLAGRRRMEECFSEDRHIQQIVSLYETCRDRAAGVPLLRTA